MVDDSISFCIQTMNSLLNAVLNELLAFGNANWQFYILRLQYCKKLLFRYELVCSCFSSMKLLSVLTISHGINDNPISSFVWSRQIFKSCNGSRGDQEGYGHQQLVCRIGI